MLTNFSNEALVVPKATVLGVAEGVSECIVDRINPKHETDLYSPVKPRRGKKNEGLYKKLLRGKLDHLTQEKRKETEPALLKYAHVFHDEESNDFECTKVIEHQILVGDTPPIRRPQYRSPYALRGEMKSQVDKMLEKGVIRESHSPWFAPAILVPKKSLDGSPSIAFVSISEPLMRSQNLIPILSLCFKRLRQLFSGQNTFRYLTVFRDFGNC
jgi:hypothetical protein